MTSRTLARGSGFTTCMACQRQGNWHQRPLPNDSDEDPDTPGKGLCSSPKDPSRFASKEKLLKLCTMMAK
eukprot:3582721-Lingulodinium_polyedra.AAC.1